MANTNDAQKLFDAIITNSCDLEKSLLEEGVDPNIELGRVIPCCENMTSARLGRVVQTLEGAPTPLHVAAVTCSHEFKCETGYSKGPAASSIVQLLLDYGADATATSNNLVLFHITGYTWHMFDSPIKTPAGLAVFLKQFPIKTPSGLAVFLKQFPINAYAGALQIVMNKAISMLQKAEDSNPGSPKLPSVRVLKSTVRTYKKLLFNDTVSDIKFVCDEGRVVLPAHRCILIAASPYFEAALQGPWAENNKNGEWKTSHPSHIMKAVLTLLYTGKIDSSLVDREPLALFAATSEFNLTDLKPITEAGCIRSLSQENIKEMLKVAHLYNDDTLKKACHTFVKRHAASLLMDPKMMNLSREDPELWSDLRKAIAPDNSGKENASSGNKPGKKRARTS